jgi:adenosylcobinamide-GDP ribazoletransferase
MAALASSLLHQCRLFFVALQFFTRLPIPRWVGFEQAWLQHASRYFPLVGIVVASVTAAAYLAAAALWPPMVAALLSTVAGILLTGAFHEDGFADMCDGFGGGTTRERVMEIMKDSRIGSYGAVGIGLVLALKVATLAALAPMTAVAALFLAHPLSRLAAAALIYALDYARDEGKAKPLAEKMSGAELAIAASCAAIPVLVLGALQQLSWRAIAAGLLGAALAASWMALRFVRRIGGFTGDCLGGVQQVTELVFYLAVLASVR